MLDDGSNEGDGSGFVVPPPPVHCSRDGVAELSVATGNGGNGDNRLCTKLSGSVGGHSVGGAAFWRLRNGR